MRNGPIPTWLTVLLAGPGLLLVIPALWVYVSVTARPLYPKPEDVPSVTHAAPSPKWADAVERTRSIVRTFVAERNLPGLSAAVGIEGDLVWAAGFGVADIYTNTPVTPDHRFRIGTASTALTSAAAGLLLENGRLRLKDEIQTYVPSFPKKQWPLTIRALMGHTGGVISEGSGDGPLFTKHCTLPVEALQYFAESSLLFKPGTQYHYSSYGWVLVSTAIEAAANQPFLTFMREQIFAPLGMRDTVPDQSGVEADDDFPLFNLVRELIFDPRATRDTSRDSTQETVQHRVTPYYTRFASDPRYGVHLMRPLDYSCYAGASVFLSTPSDLVRFGMAINSRRFLQPGTVRLLQSSQRLASGVETGNGLGWYARTVTLAGKQARVTGQDGDSRGGMVASLLTVPEYGIVVAVMSNVSYADTFSLAIKIVESFVEPGYSPAIR